MISHSIQSEDPPRRTAPSGVVAMSRPAKRSRDREASWPAVSAWSTPRIETPIRGEVRSLGQVLDEFCTEKSTSGGSKDTPTEKDEESMPAGAPSTFAHSAAIPDGKRPNAWRSSEGSLETMPSSTARSSAAEAGEERRVTTLLLEWKRP